MAWDAAFAVGELQAIVKAARQRQESGNGNGNGNGQAAAPGALPRISQAPPPITPTRGSGTRATRSLEEMSPLEYIDYMNKEESRRVRR
jgi:hypothetical protein